MPEVANVKPVVADNIGFESVTVALQPSRYLMIYSIAVFCLGLLAIALLSISGWWRLLLAVLFGMYFAGAWRRYMGDNHVRRPSQLSYDNQQWRLMVADKPIIVQLKEATVWRWLVTLRLRAVDSRKMYTLVLLPDSCDRDQLRRLRVLLRYS